MWNCYLCRNNEEWTRTGLCTECTAIKRIIDVYGVSVVKDSLHNIFVRDITPIENRTKQLKINAPEFKTKLFPVKKIDPVKSE